MKQRSLLNFIWIIWAACDMHLVFSLSKDEVENHLNMAKLFLGKGQLADALSHYHAAIDGDPGNYMAYFKRATVYLALGKAKNALHDIERVLELKPDFVLARSQRAGLLVKQGVLDDALAEYRFILAKDSANAEALAQVRLIEEAKMHAVNVDYAIEQQDYQFAIAELTRVLEISPSDVDARKKRASFYELVGDFGSAVSDLRNVAKLQAEQTQPHLALSLALFKSGDAEESLNAIRECLKLDNDQQTCKKHYTFLRKLVKQLQGIQEDINTEQYAECVKKTDSALGLVEGGSRMARELESKLCFCLSKPNAGDPSRGIKVCGALLELQPQNSDFLSNRAEAYIANEQYEEAVQDYQEAAKNDNENRKIAEGLERAKKLLKVSQRRDYYKILGVKRNTNEKTIMKAYRTLAKKWHPDRYSDNDEKEAAQKKFMDIASAMEVLTDAEKRAKFDAGEDPLDPESQSGHGHPFGRGFNPFAQGGFPGGGQGGYTFHFNM